MKFEHHAVALEVKFAGAQPGEFEGLAAAYGNIDQGGDVFAPGAFAASLLAHKAEGTKPALLWSHDQSEPIGVVDTLEETPAGLTIKGRLAMETMRGAEAYALAKMGGMTGLSVGYIAIKSTRDGKGVRTISRAHLGEVSFVTVAMNPQARVTSVKAAGAAGEADMDEQIDGAVADNAEINTKIADLEAKAAKIDELETKLADAAKRADDFELRLARPGVIASTKDSAGELQRKAFTNFLRHGREALQPLEAKQMVVADDSRGGFLAPPEFSKEVDKNLVVFSPVRAAARVGQTSSGSVIIPRRLGEPTAVWCDEAGARTETNSTYGQAEIPVNEMACWVDVSNRLLEDAAVNVEAEVAYDLAEQFGKVEGAAFVTGNGVAKPEGFMVNENVSFSVSGDATHVTADSLISLLYALKPGYRANATWMMNGATLALVRQLKDGFGNWLWQPGLQASQPETLLGCPLLECPDMPDIGAGAYPIVIGDFNAGYRIYDRVSLSLLRDPYSQATNGLVRFHARRRVGAGVVRPEAIRKLKIAAA